MIRSLQQARSLVSPAVTQAWDEATALKAVIDRREAERNKPQPVITPILLMVIALAVFAVNLAVFGKGAW